MVSFQSSRRSMIARRGRPMTLNRLSGSMASGGITTASLALTGFLAAYRPQDAQGDVRSGDALVQITNDELAAAEWTPPKARDQMIIDGATWSVVNSMPVYDGPTLIGHTIWVRGGAG